MGTSAISCGCEASVSEADRAELVVADSPVLEIGLDGSRPEHQLYRRRLRQLARDWPVLDHLPFYHDLVVDTEGLISLQVYQPPLGNGASWVVVERIATPSTRWSFPSR